MNPRTLFERYVDGVFSWRVRGILGAEIKTDRFGVRVTLPFGPQGRIAVCGPTPEIAARRVMVAVEEWRKNCRAAVGIEN